MMLLTKEIIAKFEKAPLYSLDGKNIVPVIVKFFHPLSRSTRQWTRPTLGSLQSFRSLG
jgi:hypothetical protein